MPVHFLLLHYRTFEKEFLLLAVIREIDDIDTDQFQACRRGHVGQVRFLSGRAVACAV